MSLMKSGAAQLKRRQWFWIRRHSRFLANQAQLRFQVFNHFCRLLFRKRPFAASHAEFQAATDHH